jgi:protocatechuate 3,4-dioxygenase beta subunit
MEQHETTFNTNALRCNRRNLLTRLASGVLLCTGGAALARELRAERGAFAEELVRTPRLTEGPFYPDKLPLDTDNDLLVINDSITPAVGAVTHLSGRILDARGEPIRSATIEIWQVDNKASYIHSNGGGPAGRDRNFQGYGRFLTGSTGEYYFRTIKPVPYPGRTPHIHVAVKVKGWEKFTTQCFVKGEPRNDRDGVLNGIRDPKQRDHVIVPFAAMPTSRIGELVAKFDILLGFTPEA